MTQEDRLVNYLLKVGEASVRDIMLEVGIGCPTKAISRLMRSGYDIRKQYKTGVNRYGEKTRYMVYKLEG